MSHALQSHFLAAQNNAWANATVYAAIRGMDAAAFTATRPGFFPSLSKTLNHVYEVDLYYLDALENGGKGRAVFDRTDITEVDALAAAQAQVDARLIAFCTDMTEARLAEHRMTDRRDGQVRETIADLLPHLIQHQIHHRGQAHVQVQDAGIAPPQLDDFYLTFGRVPSAVDYRSSPTDI